MAGEGAITPLAPTSQSAIGIQLYNGLILWAYSGTWTISFLTGQRAVSVIIFVRGDHFAFGRAV